MDLPLTRRFIGSIPHLGSLVAIAAQNTASPHPHEHWGAIGAMAKSQAEDLGQFQLLYRLDLRPGETFRCSTCGVEGKGLAWEFTNPLTWERARFSSLLMHAFLVHEQMEIRENLVSVDDLPRGVRTLRLDPRELFRVMRGADVPSDVLTELENAQLGAGGSL
jgi:hypothetical protein